MKNFPHLIGLGIVLAGLWLLLSGYTEAWLLWLGFASVLGCVFIADRMGLVNAQHVPVHLLVKAPAYFWWLTVEIIKSNWDVAIAVLCNDINPRLIRVKASQEDDLGRVIYANSITLTPGTISVDIKGDKIMVHALTDKTRKGVKSGDMDRMVVAFTDHKKGA